MEEKRPSSWLCTASNRMCQGFVPLCHSKEGQEERQEQSQGTRDKEGGLENRLQQHGFPSNIVNEFLLDPNQCWILCAFTTVRIHFQLTTILSWHNGHECWREKNM